MAVWRGKSWSGTFKIEAGHEHGGCLSCVDLKWRIAMRKKLSALAFAALALAAVAGAQDKMSKDEHRSVAQVLDRTVMNVEHEFVPAAEAMPEDKFGFAPSSGEFKGVRTFGEQIRSRGELHLWSGNSGRKGSRGCRRRIRPAVNQD